MELAGFALLELEQMGCQVLSVYITSNRERARIHIANPEPLEAWLDQHGNQSALEAGQKAKWLEGSAVFRESEVIWLIPSPVQTSAQQTQ